MLSDIDRWLSDQHTLALLSLPLVIHAFVERILVCVASAIRVRKIMHGIIAVIIAMFIVRYSLQLVYDTDTDSLLLLLALLCWPIVWTWPARHERQIIEKRKRIVSELEKMQKPIVDRFLPTPGGDQ